MPKTKSKTPIPKPIPKLLPESFTEELTEHLNQLFTELCKLHQGNAVISNMAISGIPLKDLRAKHEMNNDLVNLAEQLNKLLNNPQDYEPLAKILGNPNEPKPIKEIVETYNVAGLRRRIQEVTKLWAEIFLLKNKQEFLIKENSRLAEKQLMDKPPRKRNKPDTTEKENENESTNMDTIIQLTKLTSRIEEELEENKKAVIELKTQVEFLNHSNSTKDEEIKALQQQNIKKRKHEASLEEKDQLIEKLRRVNSHLTAENTELSQKNQRLLSADKISKKDIDYYKEARNHYKQKAIYSSEDNQDTLKQLSELKSKSQEEHNKLSDQLTQTEIALNSANEKIDKLDKQLTRVSNFYKQLIKDTNTHADKHLGKAKEARDANPPQHVREANQLKKALKYLVPEQYQKRSQVQLLLAESLFRSKIHKTPKAAEAKKITGYILNDNKTDQQTKEKANKLKQEIIQKYPSLS